MGGVVGFCQRGGEALFFWVARDRLLVGKRGLEFGRLEGRAEQSRGEERGGEERK